MATREDLIWLAGLLEGEGTFDLKSGRYPRVRVEMTDRDVVGRVASLFGSSIRSTPRARPFKSVWHAEKSGPEAAAVMLAVLPFMGARRSGKIADIIGEYRKVRGLGDRRASGVKLTRPPAIMRPAPVGQVAA